MKAEWKKENIDCLVPVKFWLRPFDLESACLNQIRTLMRLPFAVQHIAVMPDAHPGYGMPIGCILATDNVVVPNAVGVDIGCGMIAARLVGIPLPHLVHRSSLEDLRVEICSRIPIGRNWNQKLCDKFAMPNMAKGHVTVKQLDRARQQLGTLGGGNHFIEVQADEQGDIWVMIHSGSRNLGKQVADYYAKWALDDNAQHFSQVPRSADLGFFRRDHNGFNEYIEEMKYCIEFAKQNRATMMWRVLEAFRAIWSEISMPGGHVYDICHNHAAMENHMGRNVLVHRKGAAGPYRDNYGIVPGSMGSKSYIVSHKGVPHSFESTSHGAGRRMSRSQAKDELDLEQEQMTLEALGVVHGLKGRSNLDEACGAYKDIDEVMKLQEDLCNIEVVLKPILSIKG